MILLNDPRVREVPLRETGEPMVSVDGLDPRIAVDWSRSEIASTSDRFCLAREGVARMLVRAADLLPRGTRLLIKEVYRPYSRQVRSFEEGIESYRQANPGLDGEAVRELACQYVAPPEVAGHPTGGAVDAVLVRDGAELDMGTRFNDEPVAPENLTYTGCPLVSCGQRGNRRLLARAMEGAGFVNYPAEWWHWSYGDPYWGLITGHPALYGPLEDGFAI
jgi:D-alanyl-D-alanine dipeptidase